MLNVGLVCTKRNEMAKMVKMVYILQVKVSKIFKYVV